MTRRALLAFALLFAPLAGAQDGGDVGLYAPAPPPGSAFVRLLDGASAGKPVVGKIGARALPPVSPGEATPYVPVPAGDVTVVAGGTQKVTVAAGHYYTVAFGLPGASMRTLEDPSLSSRAKASVALYNLTTTPTVDLTTADGATLVVAGVGPGALGSREVNASTVGFAVRGPTGPLGTVPTTTLARGSAYAVVLREGAQVSWVEARTTTVNP